MAEDFLRRWSRRKHEHVVEAEKPKPVEKKDGAEAKPAAPLPPVEKLTPDSDFTGFMQPKVEDTLRRAALKKLFRDPHFNIPDPFEAYSGDWTVGEPIPPEMLATLNQAKTLLFDKQHEVKPEQVTEEKTEAKTEEKTAEKMPDEPRRQDA
jgi:hypothetical protein